MTASDSRNNPVQGRRLPWPIFAWSIAIALAASLFYVIVSQAPDGPYLADLRIYRESLRAAAAGGSLYDYVLHASYVRPEGFGFTYPPSAALALWPLVWLPVAIGQWLWTGMTLLVAVGVSILVAVRSAPSGSRSVRATRAAVLTTALLLSFPAVSTLILGQVSLLVAALTLVDAVVVPRRWRGWLTAVAGAIKLLPLVFVAYFLLTRQWAAAARATAGFLVATVAALLLWPADSVAFWTTRLWSTGYVGDPASNRNRALFGTLLRGGLGDSAARILWVGLVALVTLGAVRAILRHTRRGETLQAVVVLGCLGVVASPISWTHYLVWAVLAAWLLLTSRGVWIALGVLVLIGLSFPSPLMQEDAPTSLIAALGRELPGLFVVAVAALGLPRTASLRRGADPGKTACRDPG